jgi:hypothetical protein
MAQVAAEIADKQAAEEAKKELRFFDTTNGTTHDKKDMYQNTVGRLVMWTQDKQNVSINEKDEQLVVEHGTWRRRQKQPDDEIHMKVPQGDYTVQQPTTIWTQNLARKNFYQSASVGPNPFAKTSGLTQTADQTKAVVGYEGNIDFEREAERTKLKEHTLSWVQKAETNLQK